MQLLPAKGGPRTKSGICSGMGRVLIPLLTKGRPSKQNRSVLKSLGEGGRVSATFAANQEQSKAARMNKLVVFSSLAVTCPVLAYICIL